MPTSVRLWKENEAGLRAIARKRGAALWVMLARRALTLAPPHAQDPARMQELMAKYCDLPMDLADASLVTACESLKVSTVFTIDRRDFSVYRTRLGRALKMIPAG